eukprot:4201760-Lingulodinium_polyedra.AAC.2
MLVIDAFQAHCHAKACANGACGTVARTQSDKVPKPVAHDLYSQDWLSWGHHCPVSPATVPPSTMPATYRSTKHIRFLCSAASELFMEHPALAMRIQQHTCVRLQRHHACDDIKNV